MSTSSEKRQTPKLIAARARLLNLGGHAMNECIEADLAFLTPLFGEVPVDHVQARKCNLLFLYANIAADGAIHGSTYGLREIIRDSAAEIVVVASANSGDSYIKAGKQLGYGRANLVMTINRNGDAFGRFFSALLSRMKDGMSMPAAWVELHPQARGKHVFDAPSTIFACEIGPVAFSTAPAKP